MLGTNLTVFAASLVAGRTLFKQVKVFSPAKLLVDFVLVVGGVSGGMWAFATHLRPDVQRAKGFYLARCDPEWMNHYNLLTAKYGIEEEIQLEGIFSPQ